MNRSIPGKMQGMLETLRMWLMVKQFYICQGRWSQTNQTPFGYEYEYEGMEWAEMVIRWGAYNAGIVRAMRSPEDPTVDIATVKFWFTQRYFIEYSLLHWWVGWISKSDYEKKFPNRAKHHLFTNKVLLNCLSPQYAFFERSGENPQRIFITIRGEQFAAFPLGLLREWAIYLNPFGSAALTAVVGAMCVYWPHIINLLITGKW